jgi:hypothetical protein
VLPDPEEDEQEHGDPQEDTFEWFIPAAGGGLTIDRGYEFTFHGRRLMMYLLPRDVEDNQPSCTKERANPVDSAILVNWIVAW